eukprot:TRINITY_DN28773_c0_g1_i1.p1 TRINITY_DN28773_c0_g1~~TRINITY_DN28773_c0_g1_i1.p1  ORF type:complete len:760 (+),score=140.33 TRINITY_DN28773_c0_g1_i1:63-2342(+)
MPKQWDDAGSRHSCASLFADDFLSLEELRETLSDLAGTSLKRGDFDLVWPRGREEAELSDFGRDVNTILAAKGWCMLEMLRGEASRSRALHRAAREEFHDLPQEVLSDYLGAGGTAGKVTRFNPLQLTSLTQLHQKLLAEEASNELASYDADVSQLLLALSPWCSRDFVISGRTSSMLWASCDDEEEADEFTSATLSEEDSEAWDTAVQQHLSFMRRRCLGFLYVVDGSESGGQLHLCSKTEAGLSQAVLQGASSGRLLVFRSDLFSFRYHPTGASHLALLAWALQKAPGLPEEIWRAAHSRPAFELTAPSHECGRVLGLACLGAGDVCTFRGMEQAFAIGVDAQTLVPSLRFDTEAYFCKDREGDFVPYQNSYHVHGALIDSLDVTCIDPSFFGFSDVEASLMDPSQRKVLEVGYECLASAGRAKLNLAGAKIMVAIGNSGSEWWAVMTSRMLGRDWTDSAVDWNAARSFSTTASRLSHVLGLTGPAFATDTACSAGLTALCSGLRMLRSAKLSSTAVEGCLAGGINLIVDPAIYITNSAQHMLSAKGRCFTFNNGGDGYARGEGCCIGYVEMGSGHADLQFESGRIVGGNVNQDGRSASMTAPNGPSQRMCVKAALREAQLKPSEVLAFECHGTGTALGDPIEVGALRSVQEGEDESARALPVLCTSSKSNVGHGEANAGVTGFFKCLLMSRMGAALPNCHLHALNPHLTVVGWPVHFEAELVQYTESSGTVGVSSFGVSGTNAHAEVWAYQRARAG